MFNLEKAKQDFNDMLEYLKTNPDKATDEFKAKMLIMKELVAEYFELCEGGSLAIKWVVNKYKDVESKIANRPYETAMTTRNVILNVGAEEILKIIGGISGSTPYNSASAKIGIGRNSSAESPTQTGLQDTNAFYKGMDSGYPQVPTGTRTIIFQATYDNDEANFPWNEFSVVNGTGVGGKAMNRKVDNMGTKTKGIWTLQVIVTLLSD